MSIASEIRTNQDVLNKTACANCLHDAIEHDKYKCYGLDFNGTTYSSCQCKKLSFEYKIKVAVPIEDGNSN